MLSSNNTQYTQLTSFRVRGLALAAARSAAACHHVATLSIKPHLIALGSWSNKSACEQAAAAVFASNVNTIIISVNTIDVSKLRTLTTRATNDKQALVATPGK
jgi:hypothetical protein